MKLFTNILLFIPLFFRQLDEILSTRYIAITILFVVAGMKTAGLSMIVISLILAGWEAYAEMVKDGD